MYIKINLIKEKYFFNIFYILKDLIMYNDIGGNYNFESESRVLI